VEHSPGERIRVALLVSPDSFETFYRDGLGLDRRSYVDSYRNDFVWIYAAGLRKHGVDVIPYVPSMEGRALEQAPDGSKVRFVAVPPIWKRLRFAIVHAISPLERYLAEAAQAAMILPDLRRGLREDGADVLYIQEYWTGRFDLLVHALDVPVVAGEHGGSSGRHFHVLKRRALQRAAAITAQSTAERRRLRDRYRRDSVLITNGVDTTYFTPPEDDTAQPSMLVVARLVDAQKRVSDVISALAAMPEDWRLDVVGRGPDEDALRALAGQLGCAQRVKFHGWVGSREGLREHYRRCGVFVLPSIWEAVTLAVLEAMACGAPPVVTPLVGFRDLIQDGVNGALVPTRSPEQIAARVQEVYADRTRVGAAARITAVERYDRDMVMGRLAELLREAARRPSARVMAA